MNRFVWVVIGVLASASMARAAQYEIPLPELKGVYSTGDIALRFKFADVEFPVAFSHIDAIYLDLTGTLARGLWRTDDLNGDSVQPGYEERYPTLTFSLGGAWDPQSGLREPGSGTLMVEADGPFQMQGRFTDRLGMLGPTDPPNWLWLLHQNDTAIDLVVDSISEFFGGEQIIPAIAAITDARLIIEGTAVPEPTSALLLLPGVHILARRARR
ncbi:MAG TPA: hypothetical protein VHP11_03800 [Tepidisphaeraceae bacterium]|nr:hypothetical protein [Tepidisphaeraceae bacterium]